MPTRNYDDENEDETLTFCESGLKERFTEQGSALIASQSMFNKEYLKMLKEQHNKGTISMEELEEEVVWMSFECGE